MMRVSIKNGIVLFIVVLYLSKMNPVLACDMDYFTKSGYSDKDAAEVLAKESECGAYTEYIPQGLLDKVSEAMQSGIENEALGGMINDRVLTEEEILALVEENGDLRDAFARKDGSSAYATDITVMADGDNDGIPDLIARESMGGSDGSTAYVFYQGQKDGSYHKTDYFYSAREEFAVFAYEGKNYLFRTLFDYNKKIYNGIGITCYVDGRRVEQVSLLFSTETYERRITECTAEEYRRCAKRVLADCLMYYDLVAEEYDNVVGSSEKRLSAYNTYQCDLDNDGVIEQYKKSLSLPSSIYVSAYLDFKGEGRAAETLDEVIASQEGMPIMMWVDVVNGKNMINVMSQTGLDDFAVTGGFICEDVYEKVYTIQVDAAYGIYMEKKQLDCSK